jgi:LAS superfamily LD-carboxypeptidase LdcB
MDRLRSVELRMSEITAKASSVGVSAAGSQFSQVLNSQVLNSQFMRQGLGTQATASHTAAVQPPPELMAFENGRIPASQLESIGQGDHRLSRDAATAFKAMAADARRDGVTLSVSDSYRSLDEQTAMVEREGRYGEGGLAADPGTSAHGWGLAVDLNADNRSTNWMRANGSKYGFVEDVPREPWHWTYRPSVASSRINGPTKGLL